MNSHSFGRLLVALQFTLIGALILGAAPLAALIAGVTAVWLAMGLAFVVGVAALLANRPGNFNIHPAPVADGVLVRQGIYRHIRHPMYTAVLLFGLACLLSLPGLLVLFAWALLAAVLAQKAALEERWLLEKYPEYQSYRLATKRFVPWII